MVSVVRLESAPPPPPPSSPPQAATPNARAVTRQPLAATERTRKVGPSSRNTEECAIVGMTPDNAQRPAPPDALTLSEGRVRRIGHDERRGAPRSGRGGRRAVARGRRAG